LLSSLQPETITYCCQQNKGFWLNDLRSGFLIGHGASIGKEWIIAVKVLENHLQGRKKTIFKNDADCDLRNVGVGGIPVHVLTKTKFTKVSLNATSQKSHILIGKSVKITRKSHFDWKITCNFCIPWPRSIQPLGKDVFPHTGRCLHSARIHLLFMQQVVFSRQRFLFLFSFFLREFSSK
jgi:hypothetical protein